MLNHGQNLAEHRHADPPDGAWREIYIPVDVPSMNVSPARFLFFKKCRVSQPSCRLLPLSVLLFCQRRLPRSQAQTNCRRCMLANPYLPISLSTQASIGVRMWTIGISNTFFVITSRKPFVSGLSVGLNVGTL